MWRRWDKAAALDTHFGGAAGALFAGLFGWITPLIALLVRVPLVPIIFGVVPGLRANDGLLYRYPVTAEWFQIAPVGGA